MHDVAPPYVTWIILQSARVAMMVSPALNTQSQRLFHSLSTFPHSTLHYRCDSLGLDTWLLSSDIPTN